MAWRRKVLAAPEVEWTTPVHDLEPPEASTDDGLAPPPPAPAATAVGRTPRVDPQRAVLTACAVIATLALVATALMQRDTRDASRRQNCFVEAQYRSFAGNGSFDDPDEFRDALADCGVDLPDPDDE
jgi:hypothetical protein